MRTEILFIQNYSRFYHYKDPYKRILHHPTGLALVWPDYGGIHYVDGLSHNLAIWGRPGRVTILGRCRAASCFKMRTEKLILSRNSLEQFDIYKTTDIVKRVHHPTAPAVQYDNGGTYWCLDGVSHSTCAPSISYFRCFSWWLQKEPLLLVCP